MSALLFPMIVVSLLATMPDNLPGPADPKQEDLLQREQLQQELDQQQRELDRFERLAEQISEQLAKANKDNDEAREAQLSMRLLGIRFGLVPNFPGLGPPDDRDQQLKKDREKQLEALRELERTMYEPQESPDPVSGRINVHFQAELRLEDVERLKAHMNLGTLFLTRWNTCSDATLTILGNIQMTGLVLWNQPVSDAGIRALENHATLEHVSLDGLQITDAAVKSLTTIPGLKSISLNNVPISDDAVRNIARLERLESLCLINCTELTDDAFGYHLTKAEFQRFPRYDDVSRTSPGELTGKILTENYLDLIRRSLGALSSAE